MAGGALVPWSESNTEEGFSLSFEGENIDVKEDFETKAFASNVKTPAEEDRGGFTNVRSRKALTPRRLVGIAVGGSLAIIVGLIASFAGVESSPVRSVLVFGAFFAGTIGVEVAAGAFHTQKEVRERNSVQETFTLSLTPKTFAIHGSHGTKDSIPLDDIRGFEGALGKLFLVAPDGTKRRLPCSLPGAHDRLAMRLNEVLVEKRATVYR
ncbi:MAG: hypothetical protein U0174_20690 [Polyangiaceae bacterium]